MPKKGLDVAMLHHTLLVKIDSAESVQYLRLQLVIFVFRRWIIFRAGYLEMFFLYRQSFYSLPVLQVSVTLKVD